MFETKRGGHFVLLFHLLFALPQLIPDHSGTLQPAEN